MAPHRFAGSVRAAPQWSAGLPAYRLAGVAVLPEAGQAFQ